jgi:hypothetical protein
MQVKDLFSSLRGPAAPLNLIDTEGVWYDENLALRNSVGWMAARGTLENGELRRDGARVLR